MNVTVDNAAEVGRVTREFSERFDAADIKVKPSMVKNNRALALHYIDSRAVMDRLDRVVGITNWKDEYTVLPSGEVECRLSVRIAGEWVAKADVGGQSEQPDEGDRMKAAYSDALKRAAVKFGIGRFLYRMPQQWMDYDPVKKQIVRPAGPPPSAVKAAPEKPANVARRAQFAQKLAQCNSRGEYLAACKDIAADVQAGVLTEADRLALAPVARETSARFPEPAKA